MLVRDIIASKKSKGTPLGVSSADTVGDAVKIMTEHDTGSCVVVDNDQLVGMVTFREVLNTLQADPAGCMGKKVADVMNSDPAVTTPTDTVDQIRNLMTSQHIRYLPVMDEGKLTDVVSFYDVAVAVAKKTDFENRMLKQYINDWPADNA